MVSSSPLLLKMQLAEYLRFFLSDLAGWVTWLLILRFAHQRIQTNDLQRKCRGSYLSKIRLISKKMNVVYLLISSHHWKVSSEVT